MQHPLAQRRLMVGVARTVWCAAALLADAALAAQPDIDATPRDASAIYQREVRDCKAASRGEDLATCLREAQHARTARRSGQLETDNSVLQANATRRCDVFDGEFKAACLARMAGRGATSGSVAGGGILRQVETVVIPSNSGPITIEPKTDDPVILVPDRY